MALFQIDLKRNFRLKKLKILCHMHMLLVILMVKKLSEHFMKNNCKKANQKEFRVEKLSKEYAINYVLNGKTTIILLTVNWKKDIAWISEYFTKSKSLGANVKIELELSNYTTKADFKNATGVDSSDFAKTIKLANLKFVVDKSEDSNRVWNHNHLVCKQTLNHLDIATGLEPRTT